jgi:dynein heavy chain
MLYFWTKECEIGISEIKYDRKALYGALKRYSIHTSKLSSVLMRGAWRTIEEPMLPVHKSRLELMIAVSICVLISFLKNYLQRLLI